MKNFTKICLIICIALVCIGGICMCAGVALGSGPREVMEMMDDGNLHIGNFHIGRWNLFYEDGEEYEEVEVKEGVLKQAFLASEADSLEVDIRYGEVYLITGETDQIQVNIDAPERNVYQCGNDGIMELAETIM